MRKIAAIITCSLILVCFLSTSVLAAFPYVKVVPGTEKLEGQYIGSTLCYRASIQGVAGDELNGWSGYLQCRLYRGSTWIASSQKIRMWHIPYPATTPWREKEINTNYKGSAYGYYKYRDNPEVYGWLKTWYESA